MPARPFIFQGAPVHAVGADLTASAQQAFTFSTNNLARPMVDVVYIENQSSSDIYVNLEASTLVPAATATWCSGMVKAGATRTFPVAVSVLTLYTTGTAVYTGTGKNLWVTGWYAQ